MTTMDPVHYFANYTKRAPVLPASFWLVVRALVLLAALGVAALLIADPADGLRLWWGLVVPALPLVLVVMPGLWRQVCPMAFLNQMPRGFGFTLGRDLPRLVARAAFAVAVGGFVAAVALRTPLLNGSGIATAALILVSLVFAFAGGVVYKGRSGWCGTICPLGPIQRVYGQAPVVVLRNGFCPTCLGCQKNCYDFNPRGAFFGDLLDEDARYAGQRRLFYGLLPGLILGYFLQNPMPAYGEPTHLLILLGACCASAGLYGLLTAYLPLNPLRVATGFAAAALAAFYWFIGPVAVGNFAHFTGLDLPPAFGEAARYAGVAGGIVLFGGAFVAGRVYEAAKKPAAPPAGAGKARATGRGAEVVDRETGVAFPVATGATLLDAIEKAGLKINFGCRAGMCGADAVVVVDGADQLSPIGDDEAATLRRLGLEGRARLACMCEVRGPVTIDRDPKSAGEGTRKVAAASGADRAREAGIGRVVILGNGVAGMSAAEQLRRLSASVAIDIVTNEPLHFYNRMAIGRLIYGRTGMDGLQLTADDWYAENRVEVWRNTVASGIDRAAKRVTLATGETLPYDKLVLATGARCATPSADYLDHRNAFVLRAAEDGQAVRQYAQMNRAARAVVVGGGVLGVEAADALHHLGLHVTILQRADRLMNAQLDEQGSARLQAYLEGVGIQVVTNARIERWDGEGGLLRAAWLSHGPRARADLFVACLGVESNLHLAKAAGLACGRGVKVNAFMGTADADIYAVGDVAETPAGPGGLWPVGVAQAACAVNAMLGDPQPYAPPRIVLQLKCDGIDLRSFGETTARPGDEEFTAAPDDPAWWRMILRDGVMAGALYVGPPGSARAFTKAVQAGIDLAPLRRELLRGNLAALSA